MVKPGLKPPKPKALVKPGLKPLKPKALVHPGLKPPKSKTLLKPRLKPPKFKARSFGKAKTKAAGSQPRFHDGRSVEHFFLKKSPENI